MNGRIRAIGCFVLLAPTLLAGCLDNDRVGFQVVNRLTQPVDVSYVRGLNRTPIINDLKPGEDAEENGWVTKGECRPDRLVAFDQAGAVVATFPGPVCDGTVWEIRVANPS
jgi:hypothetical protein